jgi:nitrite reductase/ring-hydroxylating ferredoxin subunit
VLRCPWHGWEYDISTGRNLIDPSRKLTTYPVTVEDGDLIVHIGGPSPDALPTAAPSR